MSLPSTGVCGDSGGSPAGVRGVKARGFLKLQASSLLPSPPPLEGCGAAVSAAAALDGAKRERRLLLLTLLLLALALLLLALLVALLA